MYMYIYIYIPPLNLPYQTRSQQSLAPAHLIAMFQGVFRLKSLPGEVFPPMGPLGFNSGMYSSMGGATKHLNIQ